MPLTPYYSGCSMVILWRLTKGSLILTNAAGRRDHQLSGRRHQRPELWIQMFHRRPIRISLSGVKEPISCQTLPPCAFCCYISQKILVKINNKTGRQARAHTHLWSTHLIKCILSYIKWTHAIGMNQSDFSCNIWYCLLYLHHPVKMLPR